MNMVLVWMEKYLAFQTRLQESSQQNNLAGVFGVVSIPKDTQMLDIIDIIPTDAFSHIFPEFFIRQHQLSLLSTRNTDGYVKQDCEINTFKANGMS